MRLAEVQRRARGIVDTRFHIPHMVWPATLELYRDTLRTLLDHDLPGDARQLIEAALEAER